LTLEEIVGIHDAVDERVHGHRLSVKTLGRMFGFFTVK
jgi:hypothetical protein